MEEKEYREMEDEDVVGQVRWEVDGNSSKRSVQQEREKFEGIKVWREVGHTSTSWRARGGQAEMCDLCGLSLKATIQAIFLFGLQKSKLRQIWLDWTSWMEGTWCHHKACFQAKRSCKGDVSSNVSTKIWTILYVSY